MMHKNAGKMKKWITVPLAGVLTAAIVTTAFYKDASVAFARPSLPGIEEIINANSTKQPFKILEIVDDFSSARTGYMVAEEEPGFYDENEVSAISDMASYDERADRYMKGTATDPSVATTGSGTAAYNELKDYAFTYETYDEGPDPSKDPENVYTDTTEGIRHTSVYGSFEENPDNTGRYDPADTTGDYKPVNDGTDATKDNLTIDDVYRKLPGSDQSGYFYMHIASIIDANDSSVSENRVNVLQFNEIPSDEAWKYPFLIHEEDPALDDAGDPIKDENDQTVVYKYYDQNRYVRGTVYEAKFDDKGTVDDATDDEYVFTDTEPSVGTAIYIDDDNERLEYAGYVGKNSNDETVFFSIDGKELPLTGGMVQKTDDAGDPELDADGNPVLEIKESLAYIIYDNSSKKYCDTRRATSSDGAAIKKYYIEPTNLAFDTNGIFELVTARFEAVNDPDFLPSDFGIVDETDKVGEGNPWYHVWYYKSQSSSPFLYNKTKTGSYDFIHDYTKEIVNEIYYKGGYLNKEKFKKEVLDVDAKDCPNICIDVITKKVNQVTKEDIEQANLVYITGSGAYGRDENDKAYDLSYEAAAALITSIDKDHKAVMFDLNAVNSGRQFLDIGPNLRNVAGLLIQERIEGISQFVGEDDWKISDDKSKELIDYMLTYYANAGSVNVDLSHVVDSVFVNDNMGDRKEIIANDFETVYSDDKIDGFTIDVNSEDVEYDGFKEVKADIDEEKFYLEVAGKDVSSFNDKINKATSVRYILNYGGRRIVGKTAIKVLDIEPYYSRDIEGVVNEYRDVNELKNIYYNPTNNAKQHGWTVRNIANIRDIFAINWFKSNVSNTTDDVEVTGMGVKEFIGKIDDLNETYDLIYIGMDTAYLNTTLTNTDTNNKIGDKTKNVVTNVDPNGYVYRHIGDSIGTSGMDGNDGTWNLSGRDITPDKLRELQYYVQAGYSVILSDEFFTYNDNGTLKGIDENRVDPNSYMYDFIDWCITEKQNGAYKYLYKNVEITRNFESAQRTTDRVASITHKENFVKYLNISKLEVEVLEQPPLYNPYNTNDSNEHNYIAMNGAGLYTLDFKVKLTNDAAVDTTNTSYDCQLYIDHDADGRYEAVEMLDSLDIYNLSKNEYEDVDNEGKYHLTTGAEYTISRRVPEGYVGLIPWKLVFIENRGTDAADSLIKVAVQDYSAISDLTNKPTIKVLQITSGSSDSTNLNLWNDTRLKELYQQVIDFNLSVDHCTAKQFIERTGTIFGGGVDRLEKMYEYDMIVLGFLDMYNLSNDQVGPTKEAVLCVREYMLSGRSVLFTHDLTSTRLHLNNGKMQDNADWGSMANKYLRDIQGMDRYGYMLEYTENLKFADGTPLTEYKSKYDERFEGNRDPVGFSDAALLRNNSWQWGEIAAKYTLNISNSNNGQNERELQTVSRVNRGQVTEYPFRIGSLEQSRASLGDNNYYANEYITVATTHHQYYQLNLETDYRDDNFDDDIVVWYAISLPGSQKANYLKLNINDVRNNYYIYNKGNITYTGAGHSKIEGDEEKKLFVNTLVAAYNAGTHAPYAAYKNNETRNNKDITSTYIPYDISLSTSVADDGTETQYAEDGWLQDNVTVYFKTVNNNLQDNKKPLIAQYYVEVPSGGDLVIGTKHYKKITPVAGKTQECTAKLDGTVTYTDVADPTELGNGKTYKMEFSINELMNGNRQGVNERYHAVIYTRMRSQTKGKTVEDDKNDLAAGGTYSSLPATDSMEPLNINFTQLYDLK